MEIRERQEGTVVEEGAQVTRTPFADYFYFRHSGDIVVVRLPKSKTEPVTAEVRSIEEDEKELARLANRRDSV